MEDQVRRTLDVIRPAIQADGGDIFFKGLDDDGVVTVELTGACVSCPASTITLKAGVERILKDRVPGVTEVRQYGAEEISPEETAPVESETAVSL